MVSTENQYQSIFNRLKQNQFTIAKSTYTDRISKLKKLEKAIGFTYRESIKDVLFQDFRKPGIEVDISEIYPIVSEIRHIRKNLKNWLQAQKMPTPLALLGATSELRVEPKGVCLIISPWNFPFNLSFMPLCSAVAAGNTVVIKPSEYTKHSSSLIKKIVQEIFDDDEVTVIEGEAETAIELLKLPFNHIFFTGSPQTGKKVMAAAATNLADITLELGGKSPVIVDQNASIKSMAKRLVWGKYSNAGQICIAPDYVLVHEKIQGELLNACLEEIQKMYDTQSPDGNLSSIVNTAHFQRLKELLENSVSQGARPVNPLQFESDKNRIFPVLLADVNIENPIMSQEIFGPILPFIPFANVGEAIEIINKMEKPLALYIYSKNRGFIENIIQNTRSGATVINHNEIHFYNNHLPFGGVNNSGIGKSHGIYGFMEFSNYRPVMNQRFSGPLELLSPPYTSWKQKMMDLVIRWL